LNVSFRQNPASTSMLAFPLDIEDVVVHKDLSLKQVQEPFVLSEIVERF